ncbi:MAG TPA: peptidase M23, partial [Candidatus Mediterraneibacter avicola]|nr:peptidase M23 [Candidatus Mediterraneibacter avicola]
MKKRMRKLWGLLMALILTMGLAYSVSAVTLDEAQQKADELDEQKEAAEAEQATLSEKLNSIIADMEATQEKLTEKEAEVAAVENELVEARINANDQYESMKIRIKFMYEGGSTQFMEMLFASENMGDFLNKAEYVSRISEYDRNELIKYQTTVDEVEKKEEEVQKEYEELNTLQTQLVTQQEEVSALISSNEAELAEIQAQIQENADTLERLEAEAREAERIRQEQSSGGGSGYLPPTGGNVVSGNGFFTHPCPGYTYQSSYFGEIREFEVGGHK